MTKYKCGHESNAIIANVSADMMAHYYVWKDGSGFDGDKTECFECYCKRVCEGYK